MKLFEVRSGDWKIARNPARAGLEYAAEVLADGKQLGSTDIS